MKQKKRTSPSGVFRNEDGAIDLASIMVGILVIGMIGGVISATVFAVIPWSQDNAAKQQMDSVVSAQSAYMGLSSTNPPALPAGHPANSYASSLQLEEAGLMKRGPKYCTTTTDAGKGYTAYTKSDAGKIWTASDKKTKPELFTGALPTDCAFIAEGVTSGSGGGTATDIDGDGIPNETDPDIDGDGILNESDPDIDGDGVPNAEDSAPAGPYVDLTPKLTVLTYRCVSNTTGSIPLKSGLTGTETWDDGFAPRTYTNATAASSRTLTAGVTYKMTFDGTYKTFSSEGNSSETLANCLRSVDHWGADVGVTSTYRAFLNTPVLTDVPAHIPTTITNMQGMLHGATALNDPDVGKWDVSNVTNMTQMFVVARVFNQDLSGWNTSNVTTMYAMFENAWAFNKPLESWNTSKVTEMRYMFHLAKEFNQPLGKWNTSNVINMSFMFQSAPKFNGVLSGWDTSKVQTMAYMFDGASAFNQSLNDWNVSSLVSADTMFFAASVYNQPMDKWNTSNLQNMSMMFMSANAFNQNISNWNVSSVTNMTRVFASARAFNQPLNDWNVSNVTGMSQMFHDANSFNQPLDKWNTANVSTMFQMFRINTGFNQNITNWNVSKVTNAADFRWGAVLTAGNSPFG